MQYLPAPQMSAAAPTKIAAPILRVACVCVYVFLCVLMNKQQHSHKYLQTRGGSSTHSSCETVVRLINFLGERSCRYLCLSDRAREREREREIASDFVEILNVLLLPHPRS
jgi:hypothetical protein